MRATAPLMKWSLLVCASLLRSLTSACVLPWGDSKGTSSSSNGSGSGTSSTSNVSSEIAAACEKFAPPGCITACKTVGDCSTDDASFITSIDCGPGNYITFKTKNGGSTCFLDSGPVSDSAEDEAIASARKRAFVTSSSWTGNLVSAGKGADGLASADKLCSQAATAAELGGKWKAVLGTSVSGADERITESKGGWYNVTRSALLYSNKANLSTTVRDYSQLTDENGTGTYSGSGSQYTWWTLGSSAPEDTCGDWTGSGSYGSARSSSYFIDAASSYRCDEKASLFCVEQ